VHCTGEDVRLPVIGITRCRRVDDYVASVERAGGRARVLEVTESPRTLVDEIHGLLLTGGGDVDPVFYGEERHPAVDDAEPGRDEFEIDLVKRAMAADMPLLAICRGAQVLNVAAGGTLVQDIPSQLATDIEHRILQPKNAIAHQIRITEGSRVEAALGPAIDRSHACRVNSRHHQSVARLGRGLIASATAPDGVIEAIEHTASPFCLGVQWHPENFGETGEFNSLFESFIAEAKKKFQDL
jgi:putative glutamine amidotransferase